MGKLNFDNLTPDDIRRVTKADITNFSGEEFIKYKQAVDKYKGLRAVTHEPSLAIDLMYEIGRLQSNFNDSTGLEIRLRDESGRDVYINTSYCSINYEKGFNKLVLSNYIK